MTQRELLTAGAARIATGQDGSSAWLDATVLWAQVCGVRRDQILSRLNEPVPEGGPGAAAVASFLSLCERRATGYPVAYLIGRKEFFGRDFLVDESVLIPRPETELLVEWLLETLADSRPEELSLLDCCTGSGCLPITLGLELPRLLTQAPIKISACDLSAAALTTAERNRQSLWPAGRIAWFQGDLLRALPLDCGRFDIITANPPYVPQAEALATIPRGWCEPIMALDGGPDGLDLIRRLVDQATAWLKPGGWLFLEHGDGQSEEIATILETYNYRSTEIRCDLAGLKRMVRSQYRA